MLRSCYYIEKNSKFIKNLCLFVKFAIFVGVAIVIICPQAPNDLAVPLMLCLK